MLVVRLSRMAERKKVMKAMRHMSERLLVVIIVSRTKLKPPFLSTISTMVMAPIRKKSVSLVSPRWFLSTSLTIRVMFSTAPCR